MNKIKELELAKEIKVPPINWNGLKEDDIVALTTIFLKTAGYEPHPEHLSDKVHEQADIIAEKDGQIVNIAIKLKKPKKEDIGQLHSLKRLEGTKVYVYFREPTREFHLAMTELKDGILFVDKQLFEGFLYILNPSLYSEVFTRRHKLIDETVYNLSRLAAKILFTSKNSEILKQEDEATKETRKYLWRLKDDCVALHKSFKGFSILFGEYKHNETILWAWYKTLEEYSETASSIYDKLSYLWATKRNLLLSVAKKTFDRSYWLDLIRLPSRLMLKSVDPEDQKLHISYKEYSPNDILAFLSLDIAHFFKALETYVDDIYAHILGADRRYLVFSDDTEREGEDIREVGDIEKLLE